MSSEQALIFLLFIGAGFLCSIVCNYILLRFSQSLGIRNKNDVTIRWANESKPSLGGVSFFMAFIFGSIAYSIVFNNENIFQNKAFVGLMTAGVFAFLMGLADDAFNTKPLIKLAIQILCGLVFCFTGTSIHLSNHDWINWTLTVIWVIGIMNSLNMLDNMDGITGTIVLSILISCFATDVLQLTWNINIWTLTLLVQIGAIIGFLIYNVYPSKMFMGDAGSQFIGCFVAFFSIVKLWNVGDVTPISPLYGGFITLIAFTPAAVDTLTVIINRLMKGKSPMVGGKDHTTHFLVYSGLNDKQVWYVFVILGFFSSLTVVLSNIFIRLNSPKLIIFLSLYFVIVFFLLYRNTRKYKEPVRNK